MGTDAAASGVSLLLDRRQLMRLETQDKADRDGMCVSSGSLSDDDDGDPSQTARFPGIWDENDRRCQMYRSSHGLAGRT